MPLDFDRKRSTWTGRMKRDGRNIVITAYEAGAPDPKQPAPALLARIDSTAAELAARFVLDEVVRHFDPSTFSMYGSSARSARATQARDAALDRTDQESEARLGRALQRLLARRCPSHRGKLAKKIQLQQIELDDDDVRTNLLG